MEDAHDLRAPAMSAARLKMAQDQLQEESSRRVEEEDADDLREKLRTGEATWDELNALVGQFGIQIQGDEDGSELFEFLVHAAARVIDTTENSPKLEPPEELDIPPEAIETIQRLMPHLLGMLAGLTIGFRAGLIAAAEDWS